MKLLVLCHTEEQFRRYLRAKQIPLPEAKRVRNECDARGWNAAIPVHLLDDWAVRWEQREAHAMLRARGMPITRVADSEWET